MRFLFAGLVLSIAALTSAQAQEPVRIKAAGKITAAFPIPPGARRPPPLQAAMPPAPPQLEPDIRPRDIGPRVMPVNEPRAAEQPQAQPASSNGISPDELLRSVQLAPQPKAPPPGPLPLPPETKQQAALQTGALPEGAALVTAQAQVEIPPPVPPAAVDQQIKLAADPPLPVPPPEPPVVEVPPEPVPEPAPPPQVLASAEPEIPVRPDPLSHIVTPGQVRIKDISSLEGVRENQLIGYGLVVGLQGSGDTLRNAAFSEQSLQSMLERLGVNVREANLRTRNVAAVIVTAELPAFAGTGSRIDVNVASLGDAVSLQGGTLVITPLAGANGEVYAVAQGPVAVTGYNASGQAESVVKGTPTAGRIPNGAVIEQELPTKLDEISRLTLKLRNPDFRTAVRITDAINGFAQQRYGAPVAIERDFRSVSLTKPRGMSVARFIAEIEGLAVRPDTPARVVVDERTGTVVMGADVRISTVAVTHGNLTIRVTETPVASQPAPFSDGETVVLPRTMVDATESGGKLAIVGGTDLQTLVRGLNQIGLKPAGIIAIVQAMKTAGALQADLVIQ